MKYAISILTFVVFSGCSVPFSRHISGDAEYVERFLSVLGAENVRELQFAYHGAVGGEASIARFRIEATGLELIRDNAAEWESFQPDDVGAVEELQERIKLCSGRMRVPDWFDFPFQKEMLLFSIEREATDEHPSYLHQWYVNEDQNTVYFLSIDG